MCLHPRGKPTPGYKYRVIASVYPPLYRSSTTSGGTRIGHAPSCARSHTRFLERASGTTVRRKRALLGKLKKIMITDYDAKEYVKVKQSRK
eukprot:6193547-Pleurochrysis_carterae.AAC.2